LGGGLPIGGYIATPEVVDALESGDHYTTFGWNNLVSSAAGLEGIKVIEEEGLVENSKAMGELMLQGLKEIAEKSDIIGDVRGKGLFIGVEFVKDKETKIPNPDDTKKLSGSMLERGVITGLTGTWSNIVRIVPPLTINEDHVHQVLSTVKMALQDIGHPVQA